MPDKETELKLALPVDDPTPLLHMLSRVPILRRRKPVQVQLHNTYFDGPQQPLRQARAALRIRRVDGASRAHWIQTLKSSPQGASALTRRGEWEAPIAGPALERDALDAKAWRRLDPHGDLFGNLEPCFVTDFTRTIWNVRRRDKSLVEVALDTGTVLRDGRSTPICELELELKSGPVSALFDIALCIAASMPVLPLTMSKAQRGYALLTGTVDAPCPADPPRLKAGMSPGATATLVMREMFGQFVANLNALCRSDDPEVVHQARVAWRRLRSARRLFKPVLPADGQPDWAALRPLLAFLGDLRDIDVARTDTLAPLRDGFVAQSDDRGRAWDAMVHALAASASVQRTAVRYAMQDPAVGQCLLQITRWLDASPHADGAHGEAPLERWASDRTTRLHGRLKRSGKQAHDPMALHHLRLLAKRTRYSIEALRGVLPRRMLRKWYPDAVKLQKSIGAERDLAQALVQAERAQARSDLTAYLRGVAVGRATR